jgi:prophage antirepressor-like protein
MSEELKIAIFQKKEIRKQLHDGQWWFVINDVVAVLTDSADPAQYLRNMRNRDEELSKLFEPVEKGVVQIEPPFALPFDTPGGKQRLKVLTRFLNYLNITESCEVRPLAGAKIIT